MDADATEIRVLGSLIEKQRTTPDAYPLSLNSLRLACNQTTNRDPVVDYSEEDVRRAVAALSRRGWIRLASGPGSRAAKYRHLLDEALRLSREELAVVAVLMLRGPQTTGELKGRTERLHPFASLAEVEDLLERLIGRELVERLARRPGQKEVRYRQLLGGDDADGGSTLPAAPVASYEPGESGDRLEDLERRLAAVEQRLAELVGSLSDPDEP